MFLSPWLVGVVLLTLGPILASAYLSLTHYDLFNAPIWAGLDNYHKMFFEDRRYFQALKVTFTYVFFSVPLKLVFALAVALMLNRGLAGLGIYRAVF
ncbi:MAG TPA: ABC transporter permease, partial [Devosia sp.]|nr:ABC transporter permease [Devosia sp.]